MVRSTITPPARSNPLVEPAGDWAHRAEETDWGRIVSVYDTLMTIRPSPVVELNRAIAIAQHQGPRRGLEELRGIAGADGLAHYPFYHAALGELELRQRRHQIARDHFLAAMTCARNPMERHFLEKRIEACADHARQRA